MKSQPQADESAKAFPKQHPTYITRKPSPEQPTMLPIILAGPDCSHQFSDLAKPQWAEIKSTSAGEGCQVLPIRSNLRWQPSKTWHCTRRHLPRLRGIEFLLSIRRREASKVAKSVAWKVTNSNDAIMNSTQGIHEAMAPNFEDHQAPSFPRLWIPEAADPAMTCRSDTGSHSCWRHVPRPRRR